VRKIIPIVVCNAVFTFVTNLQTRRERAARLVRSSGVSPNQCWDVSRNVIRTKDKGAIGSGGSSDGESPHLDEVLPDDRAAWQEAMRMAVTSRATCSPWRSRRAALRST
jgi:hypothetical protein